MQTNTKILSDIKNSQISEKNKDTLNSIKKLQAVKTPLAHLYTGDTWNTDLPEKAVENVVLLMNNSKGRYIVANANILYINGKLHIQNSSFAFMVESLLVGWMESSKALMLLDGQH